MAAALQRRKGLVGRPGPGQGSREAGAGAHSDPRSWTSSCLLGLRLRRHVFFIVC